MCSSAPNGLFENHVSHIVDGIRHIKNKNFVCEENQNRKRVNPATLQIKASYVQENENRKRVSPVTQN